MRKTVTLLKSTMENIILLMHLIIRLNTFLNKDIVFSRNSLHKSFEINTSFVTFTGTSAGPFNTYS